MNKTPQKRKTWKQPWRYTESFIVAFGLVFTGFAIEYVSPEQQLSMPGGPYNIIIGVALIAVILALYYGYKNQLWFRWLRSVEAATGAIAAFVFVAAFLALFPQGHNNVSGFWERLGMYHILNSWPYMLSFLWLLFILGIVSIHRAIPFRRKNIGFLLNHFGLWLILWAATLGSGDLMRLRLYLYEGEDFEWRAIDSGDNVHELPLAVKLVNFGIDEYAPKLALINTQNNQILGEKNKNLITVKSTLTDSIEFVRVEVLEYLPEAQTTTEAFVADSSAGAAPAARVRITNKHTNESTEQWITCGSYNIKGRYAAIDSTHAIAMLLPEPQRFYSEIVTLTPDSERQEHLLEVNQPIKINRWKLYQLSYEEAMGKWSNLSIVEAVRDPWLPLVYTGIFMLMAGNIYLFWLGKSITPKHLTEEK